MFREKGHSINNIFHRKAQSTAGSAATLVVLIGAIIILYILFLPPSVRESLLNPENESSSIGNSDQLKTRLLDKSPGNIDYVPMTDFEHNIASFNLKKSTSSKILARSNAFLIKKTWFSTKEKTVRFDIPNLENTQDVQLAFNTIESQGRLTVRLNGEDIFTKTIEEKNINPIEIKKENLMKENELIFEVSSPGWKFWDSNSYEIDNLVVTGDVSDESNLEGEHTFYVEAEEKRNINNARLILTPVCNKDSKGKLSIDINNQNIYSAMPDCGTPMRIDFSTDKLKEGDNKVTFSSAGGEYLIDTVSIKTEVSDVYYPTYYFELTASQYERIDEEDDSINMTFHMLDNDEFKEAYISVNNRRSYIDTDDAFYTKDISTYVQEGSNTLQIKPLNSFEITRLEVNIYD